MNPILEIERLIRFGPPAEIQTPKGLRILRQGRATRGFWTFWNDHHEVLKAGGHTIRVDRDGRWWVRQWRIPKLDPVLEQLPTVGEELKSKLLRWQVQPTQELVRILSSRQFVLDASDAGIGKTAHSCASGVVLGRPLAVLCSKYAKPGWRWMAKHLGTRLLDVQHYEMVREGKTAFGRWMDIDRETRMKDGRVRKTKESIFVWDPSLRKERAILVIDEIHNCGGVDTKNSGLAISTRKCGISTIGISATAADKPTRMKALAYLLDLIRDPNQFTTWAIRHGCILGSHRKLLFGDDRDHNVQQMRQRVMQALNRQIFDGSRAIRIRKADIPDFPQREIHVMSFDFQQSTGKIRQQYNELKSIMDRIARRELKEKEAMGIIVRIRQMIEKLKIETVVQMVKDDLDEGYQVVIFCNYRETVIELGDRLGVPALIGGQKESERLAIMADFQSGKNRAAPGTYGAGSESINLQDESGLSPRKVYLFPTFRSQHIIQAMDRIHRATSKSIAEQIFIFAAGTIEEETMENLRDRMANLQMLNDGHAIPLPHPVEAQID